MRRSTTSRFRPSRRQARCNFCAAEVGNIMLQLLARARERLSGAIPPLDAGRTRPPSNGPKQPPFGWELSSGQADGVAEIRDRNPGRIHKPGSIGYRSV